jgi:hypothetical protein
LAKSASRAWLTAVNVGGLIEGVVVDPPEAWPGGKVELPMFDRMSATSRPSSSAAMTARMVRAPVPMSWVALLSSTEPSGLMMQVTCLSCVPPPPHWCRAMPSPRLIGPLPFWPRGLRFSLQPISSAPSLTSAW